MTARYRNARLASVSTVSASALATKREQQTSIRLPDR
jgi:hypothetical protein